MPPDSTTGSPRPAAPAAQPSLEAAIASQDWSDLARRLTKYAHVRLRKTSWETAEELAQEAIARLLDAAYASWDRERHPDIFDCLGHIVNGLAVNHGRRHAVRARHVPLRDDDEPHDDELPDAAYETANAPREEDEEEQLQAPPPPGALLTDERTAESALLAQGREAEAAIAMVRVRLAGDELALGLLERIQRGEGSAAAHAKALGVNVQEVYTAMRRLTHHARLVGRELKEGES